MTHRHGATHRRRFLARLLRHARVGLRNNEPTGLGRGLRLCSLYGYMRLRRLSLSRDRHGGKHNVTESLVLRQKSGDWRLLDDIENIYILEFSNAFMAPRHQKSVVARS